MVHEKGLAKKVFLLGFRKDITPLLHSFDIFLLTSRYEGLPRTILQAHAAKKPVVATAVDGIPEAVIHNKTGLLAQVHDTKKLADHILFLLDHPDIAANMGKQGSQNLAEFSCQKMLKDLDALYIKLIEEKIND